MKNYCVTNGISDSIKNQALTAFRYLSITTADRIFAMHEKVKEYWIEEDYLEEKDISNLATRNVNKKQENIGR